MESVVLKIRKWSAFVAMSLLVLTNTMAFSQQEIITFVRDDEALGQIVVGDNPDRLGIHPGGYTWQLNTAENTLYAAAFLQEYVEKITAVKVPIVTASGADLGRPAILVGRSSLTDFVEPERQALAPEGFIIRGAGNRVAIVGEIAPDDDLEEYRGADRGTLFGVYELLEQFGGVRWYFPHELGRVVPRAETFSVRADVNITKSPHFRMRTGGLYRYPGEDLHPCIRPGNTTGFNMNHTHGHGTWERYIERNFPDMPELFALGPDGVRLENRPCYSNMDNLKVDLQRIQDWDEKGVSSWWSRTLVPSEKYVQFLPTDIENVRHCQCSDCQSKWIEGLENSKLSNLVLAYAVDFAKAIAERYPGRRLATGAYSGFLYPPPGLEIPENMDIMVCTVKGNAKLVAPGHWNHNVELIETWFEHLNRDPARLFIFEYFYYPINNAPNLYPYTMQKWMQFLKDKTVGAFNNGHNPTRAPVPYRQHILNGWLWHQLLWNPDADVDALMQRFHGDLFGPAAEPMKAMFDTAIDRWENHEWGMGLNAGAASYVHGRTLYRDIFPPKVIRSMTSMLEDARESAGEDGIYRERIEYFAEAFEFFFTEALAHHAAYDAFKHNPVYVAKKVAEAPRLDGRLDEDAWTRAEAIELVGWRLGETPALGSVVNILKDDNNLYFGASLKVEPGSELLSRGSRRGDADLFSGDHLAIDFNLRKRGFLDLPEFYRVAVNPDGLIATGIKTVPLVHFNVHHSNWNEWWAPEGIKAEAQISDDRWDVELVVPLSSFPEYDAQQKDAINMQIIRVNQSPPTGTFSWVPVFAATYEYDLNRMGKVSLREAD